MIRYAWLFAIACKTSDPAPTPVRAIDARASDAAASIDAAVAIDAAAIDAMSSDAAAIDAAVANGDLRMPIEGRDVKIGVGIGPGIRGPERDTYDPPKPPPPEGDVVLASAHTDDTTSLTADVVAKKINAMYIVGIKRCYDKALLANAALAGRLDVTFTVNERGRATGASAGGMPDALIQCATSQISTFTFPVPKDADKAPASADFAVAFRLAPKTK